MGVNNGSVEVVGATADVATHGVGRCKAVYSFPGEAESDLPFKLDALSHLSHPPPPHTHNSHTHNSSLSLTLCFRLFSIFFFLTHSCFSSLFHFKVRAMC